MTTAEVMSDAGWNLLGMATTRDGQIKLGDTSPAHVAASMGHAGFLRVLHELGGAAALCHQDSTGWWPAHAAAKGAKVRDAASPRGHPSCLRVLRELGGLDAIRFGDNIGETPAHIAAEIGDAECLRVLLLELGGDASSPNEDGVLPAHSSASNGHDECLRVIQGLGGEAEASLWLQDGLDERGQTTAHRAASGGHEACLALLHQMGGATFAKLCTVRADARDYSGNSHRKDCTPAHLAASNGHEGCLRFLHGLGGEVAASLATAQDDRGFTPAHDAAEAGHVGCLRVLHEFAGKTFAASALRFDDASLGHLASIQDCLDELRALRTLSWTQPARPYDKISSRNFRGYGSDTDVLSSPALLAARGGHVDSLRFLMEIGGADMFFERLRHTSVSLRWRVHLCLHEFACLLSDPSFLDLATKRAWLSQTLREKVDDDDFDAGLNLEVHRGSVLEGVCAQLGVEEQTGRVQAEARGVRVTFRGEAADGDALRREWLGAASAEMIDPACGLFLSKDGGRTLQPNPESGSTHGADHLSYFALLGRIAGLALYHREQLDVAWSPAFLKAVLGSPMTVDDVASADPEAGDNLRKMRGYTAEELEACGVTFEIDSDESVVYDDSAKRRRTSIELKPGGAEIEVTRENLEEYLALYAHHRLVKSIEAQVGAVREGLGVFVDDEVRATLRSCCTVAEFQLLLCGTKEVDVDDWQGSARCGGGYTAASEQVGWFWAEVRAMTQEEQGKLLHFCTGSVRAPATGFSALMGYQGQQQRFTIERDPRGAERLPVASACFNKLLLPAYVSRETLAAKLRLAISLSEGFQEAAVAV